MVKSSYPHFHAVLKGKRMSDSFTVRATLTGLTINPGKESGDDPIVTLTLAPDFEDELKALVKRVGQQIDITLRPVQASLPMSKAGR
jgi:hypothetical protein